MNSLNLKTVVVALLAALVGGMIGTRVIHPIDQQLVKKLEAIANKKLPNI
jgi:uncharacterized membrane protein YfcA